MIDSNVAQTVECIDTLPESTPSHKPSVDSFESRHSQPIADSTSIADNFLLWFAKRNAIIEEERPVCWVVDLLKGYLFGMTVPREVQLVSKDAIVTLV